MNIGYLIEAVVQNNSDEVKKLLNAGVNPNHYEDLAKLYPIHFAALYNALDVVPLLVKAGADATAKSSEGITAMEIAKQHNHLDMVQLLMKFKKH